MELGLKDKVAIVTGGSSGIGRATALAFAEEGAKIVIVARKQAALNETIAELEKAGGEALAIQADLTRLEDVQKVVDETLARFGQIDILINNAGSAMGGPFLEIPDEQWFEAMQLKFFGYVRMARAVVPGMVAQGSGRIVNIIGAAAKEPGANFLPGSTTNSAIRNFTKGLALSLKPHNILVNAVHPGNTRTPRVIRLWEQEARQRGISVEQIEKERKANFVGGHLTEPEEIAAVAVFLCSKQVATLTGAEIDVNGGTTAGL